MVPINVHIMHEDKFIDNALDLFNKNSQIDNYYIIFHEAVEVRPDLKRVFYVNDVKSASKVIDGLELRNKLGNIIIHFFDLNKLILFNIVSDKFDRSVFISWGGDFYNRSNFKIYDICGFKTCLFYLKRELVKDFLVPWALRDIYHGLFKQSGYHYQYQKAIRDVDCICTILDTEIELYKKKFGPTKEYLTFSYGDFTKFILNDEVRFEKNRNVIFGNSATVTNNHLDAIKYIRDSNSVGKIIIPLSYGDKIYAKLLMGKLLNIFNDKLEFLTDYIEKKKYNKIISKAGFFIFNNYRQQGLGNAITAIHSGAKVFFSEKSPVYRYFKNNNLHVYKISDFPSESKHLLEDDKARINRELIEKLFSESTVSEKIKHIVTAS